MARQYYDASFFCVFNKSFKLGETWCFKPFLFIFFFFFCYHLSTELSDFNITIRISLVQWLTAFSNCMKSVRIQSLSCSYFSAFGLNTERYGVSVCIQSKCGNKRSRKTPNTDTSYADFFSWMNAIHYYNLIYISKKDVDENKTIRKYVNIYVRILKKKITLHMHVRNKKMFKMTYLKLLVAISL